MRRWVFDKSSFFLILIFVVATALIFFLMGLTYKHLEKLSDNTDQVNHSYEVSILLNQIKSEIRGLESDMRNYILTNNPEVKQTTELKISEIRSLIDGLKNEVDNNPKQHENSDSLTLQVNRKIAMVQNVLLSSPNETQENLTQILIDGKAATDAISKKVDEMLLIEESLMIRRKAEFGDAQKSAPLFIYVISIFALGVLGFAFYKMLRDVREQQKANNQLKLAVDASNLAEIVGLFGVWTHNLETGEYTFTDNFYRLLGLEPQSTELDFTKFARFIHPDDLEMMKEFRKKVIHENHTKPFVYRVILKDGTIKYFESSAKILNNYNEEKLLLGILSDVTDEVNTSHILEEKNRTLEAANQELMAFNYVASHDLQEPLRKIETFITRLKEKDRFNLSEAGRTFLDKMHSSAGRMRVLIEDLLQFSRTTRSEQVFEDADLNELMAHSKEELHELIQEKNAKITVEHLPEIKVIPFQIQQLFTNLLNNSLKYSKEGVPPEISVTVQKTNSANEPEISATNPNSFYKFTFTDNGIGFEQEYAQKIFEVFNRLHNKDEFAGTGIGLSVCKKIVENHHGFIFAKGERDVGAVFTFYIPERQ